MSTTSQINKKNTLGTTPVAPGVKDAIHVAILSGYAAAPLSAGDEVYINPQGNFNRVSKQPYRERNAGHKATPIGVCDPFRGPYPTGSLVWVLVSPNKVKEVRHEWDLEGVDASASQPTRPDPPVNEFLAGKARVLGVTLPQLMEALDTVYRGDPPPRYPGCLSFRGEAHFTAVFDGHEKSPTGEWVWVGDVWEEWGSEVGVKFPNYGTECCPETEYPSNYLFDYPEDTDH
jgi:hypothetical protein